MTTKRSIYDLTKAWFNWCNENPTKVSPNITAVYYYCLSQFNRFNWIDEIPLSTERAMEAIGIHSHDTYSKAINKLIEFGFIIMVRKSYNRFTSNIVSLSNFSTLPDILPYTLPGPLPDNVNETRNDLIKDLKTEEDFKTLIPQEKEKPILKIKNFSQISHLCVHMTDGLQKAIKDHIENRNEMDDSFTGRAFNMYLKKLLKLSGDDQQKAIEIINNSIISNWSGIFQIKNNNNVTTGSGTKKTSNIKGLSDEFVERNDRLLRGKAC